MVGHFLGKVCDTGVLVALACQSLLSQTVSQETPERGGRGAQVGGCC